MSKSEPFIGPQNNPNKEPARVTVKYLEDYSDVLATSGLAVLLALLVKGVLKIETIQSGSLKKMLQSFMVITVAGGIVHEARMMKKV